MNQYNLVLQYINVTTKWPWLKNKIKSSILVSITLSAPHNTIYEVENVSMVIFTRSVDHQW